MSEREHEGEREFHSHVLILAPNIARECVFSSQIHIRYPVLGAHEKLSGRYNAARLLRQSG